MRKSTRILKRLVALFLVVLLSCEVFAAAVGDNDGAAFITKAEFDSLKNEFIQHLNAYNTSIDNKIESVISQYLAGMKSKQTKDLTSILNTLSENRRTFVGPITNIADWTQNNLYIETNGFWVAILPLSERTDGNWTGYMLAGINNYESGHWKNPMSRNSRDNTNQDGYSYPVGSYFLIDPISADPDEEYFYITDSYLKNLNFYIYSCGASIFTTNGGANPLTSYPSWSIPTSITWDNTYNWSGRNNRKVGTGGGKNWEVDACEAICLQLINSTAISWCDNMSGSAIYTTQAGCLTSDNQYNWKQQYTNYWLWHDPAAQCLGAIWNGTSCAGTSNDYNSAPFTPVKLNFKAPKISRIKGDKFVVKDVCDTTGEYVKYYSGLPLATFPKKGKLTLKLAPTLGGSCTSFRVALAYNQFENCDIGSEPRDNILFDKTFNTSDIDVNGHITIEIDEADFEDISDRTIWIKANPMNGSSTKSVCLKSERILFEYEG